MPYPFAHPAAVIPLAPLMGRFAVPSALVIGSILPDLWYFVPMVTRVQSHSAAGLIWFCIPAGLAAYALFHLMLKEPLVALLSPRLGTFSSPGLPGARWHAVVLSILAGAATHQVWDALTHSNSHSVHNWPQHASTALGTLVLVWWGWRKLRSVPSSAGATLSLRSRILISMALVGAAGTAAIAGAVDDGNLRTLARSAGIAALQAAAVAIFVYCAVWHLRTKRMTSA